MAVNEEACRAALECIRWPEGPVCPECAASGPTVKALRGKAHRAGLYLCAGCRTQFTVTAGTPLKGSKLPLSAWMTAAHLLSDHKPVTVREVQMTLGVTYKTAWHTVQKLLEGMDGYRGRLSLPGEGATFGATVSAHVAKRLPKNRNSRTSWWRKQQRIRKGTYVAPAEPVCNGALSAILCPPATKAHVARTERFLRWVMRGDRQAFRTSIA